MAKLRYFLIASDVIEGKDGRLSFINLFDQLTVTEKLPVTVSFVVAAGLADARDVQEAIINVYKPTGDVLSSVRLVGSPTDKINLIGRFNDITMEKIGIYSLRLFINGAEMSLQDQDASITINH
ncbi:MAG: hypothetical protein M1586_00595 [Patescibacteria group bacterium]|nr:hypothetical protein [Patescibacteria group bacterium]MCL5261785.1 hypothetical protein [Patescibacteria group bacterium]